MKRALMASLLAFSMLFTMLQMPVDAKTTVSKTAVQKSQKSAKKTTSKVEKKEKTSAKKSTAKKSTAKTKKPTKKNTKKTTTKSTKKATTKKATTKKASTKKATTTKKTPVKKSTAKTVKQKAVSRSGNLQEDASKLISLGLENIGVTYKHGGMSPKGFDCSGFTSYVYKNALGITLPRTAIEQSKFGSAVEKSQLRPGDILYFNTSGGPVNHVGIYIGDGKFMHASSGKVYSVTVSSLNSDFYRNCYRGARRVIE